VLGRSAKLPKLVTGKCVFGFKANLWKLWELLVTPTYLQSRQLFGIEDFRQESFPSRPHLPELWRLLRSL
jgi:hypothetical protein